MTKRLISGLLSLCFLAGLLFAFPVQAEAQSPAVYKNMSASYRDGPYYRKLMAVELTGNQITDLISVARSQVGYTAGNSKNDLSGTSDGRKKFVEYFNLVSPSKLKTSEGAQWCATFVTWCFREAGIPTSVMPTAPGCGRVRNSVKTCGATFHPLESGYKPVKGDIVLYESMNSSYTYYAPCKRDASGLPTSTSHVGIVSKDYNGKTFTTIQRSGNTVKEFTEKLTTKGKDKNGKYVINRIQGFVTPNYRKTEAKAPVTITRPAETTNPAAVIPSNGSVYVENPITTVGGWSQFWPKADNADHFTLTVRNAEDTGTVLESYDNIRSGKFATFYPQKAGSYVVWCDAVSATGGRLHMETSFLVWDAPTFELSRSPARVGEPVTVSVNMPKAGGYYLDVFRKISDTDREPLGRFQFGKNGYYQPVLIVPTVAGTYTVEGNFVLVEEGVGQVTESFHRINFTVADTSDVLFSVRGLRAAQFHYLSDSDYQNVWFDSLDTSEYGTCDVWINGELAADDVSEFDEMLPPGTEYEIRDIQAQPGYFFPDGEGAAVCGVVGSSETIEELSFVKRNGEDLLDDSLSLVRSDLSIQSGDSALLRTVIGLEDQPVTWISSDESVAVVEEGVVTAVGPGQAVITLEAEDSGNTASCQVTVDGPAGIANARAEGSTVRADVFCERTGASVWCAAYGADGQMISAVSELAESDGIRHTYTLELGTADYQTAKVFLLDGDGSPLCGCVPAEK